MSKTGREKERGRNYNVFTYVNDWFAPIEFELALQPQILVFYILATTVKPIMWPPGTKTMSLMWTLRGCTVFNPYNVATPLM